jgi:hypothetical protein
VRSQHSTRRFFVALLTVVVGIAVPMTLKPSGTVLAVLWSIIVVALAGLLLTWEPVARRLPYRVVPNVAPGELPRETASADAALADKCERLADDINAWLAEQPGWNGAETRGLIDMPPEFSALFNGRLFSILESLTNRKYITREQRDRRVGHTYLQHAAWSARFLREWSHRLRRR